MMLAAQPNHPIRRLVLNDVGAYVPSAALQRIGRYLVAEPRPFDTLDDAEDRLREVLAPFGDVSDREWRHLTEHSFRRDEETSKWVARHDPSIARTYRQWQFVSVDLWRFWREISAPVLILRGIDSDFLLPAVVSRMLASGPPAEAVELAGCGHVPSLMRDEHIEPVLSFLQTRGRKPRTSSTTSRAGAAAGTSH
jgi:pimeloyl-ACP methyl ester carboxylesterase